MPALQGQSSLTALITFPILNLFSFLYVLVQAVIDWVFAPVPPPPTSAAAGLPKKRVAVIGAGVTGVSSAAHCVGHGFDVQVFEARSQEKGLGGIWSVCYTSYGPLKRVTTGTNYLHTASKLNLLPADPQHYVSIPPFGAI